MGKTSKQGSKRHSSPLQTQASLIQTQTSLLKTNKAQLTVVIIVGIVLIIIFAAAFFILSDTKIPLFEQESADTKAVRAFVESCIQTETQGALRAMAVQGGLLFLTDRVVTVEGIEIPIALQKAGVVGTGATQPIQQQTAQSTQETKQQNTLPTKQEMSQQLGLYLNAKIEQCANFTEFEQRGLTITKKDISTTPTISNEKITIDVEFPMAVSLGDITQELTEFLYDQESNLGDMHSTATTIINNILKDPLTIDYVFLSSLGYNTTVFAFNQSIMVYTMTEPIGATPLLFQFATEHEVQQAPYFDAPDSFTLKQNKAFLHQFKATDANNNKLVFSDDTSAFDILEDGKLLFTPEIVESFNATITVTDQTGLSFLKIIQFEVVE